MTVSVLFADLAGFTTFSETRRPTEVIAMLNAYWAVVVPGIDQAGGVIEQFAGDGVMVTFNALVDQPDHALRAARPAWRSSPPRARRRRPSGLAGVPRGHQHRAGGRGHRGCCGPPQFAVIGDTTNTAARLMSVGGPGDVTIARATWEHLPETRAGTPLGELRVKGRRTPVDAWQLRTAS